MDSITELKEKYNIMIIEKKAPLGFIAFVAIKDDEELTTALSIKLLRENLEELFGY